MDDHAPASAARRAAHVAFESAAVIGTANAFAEVVVYGRLVAPRFASIADVPFFWWVVVYLPALAACLVVGRHIHTRGEAVVGGIVAGLVAAITKFALGLAGAPGHESSAALAEPARFWTLHVARMAFGFVVVLLVVHAATARRARPPSAAS